MPAIILLTGKRFGRLLVTSRDEEHVGKKVKWKCLCDCGKRTSVDGWHLKNGGTKSCGCFARDRTEEIKTDGLTHGMSKTREYYTWGSMIQRCTNKKSKDYKHYGGRGITVTKRWFMFANFFLDMGLKPEGFQLDRLDNNLGYSKENCKWVPRKTNAQNSRNSKIWEVNGLKFQSLSDAAKHFNVDNKTISRWCNEGKDGCYCHKKYDR